MNADPDAQRRLLELQAIDTALTQLDHRQRHLPEHAENDRLETEIKALVDERARAQVAVDDLDRDIARLERDIEQVRQRADRDRTRLEAGTGHPKELERLQHELGTLGRRQRELEDAELEFMEQREEAQRSVDAADARLDAARSELLHVGEARDAAVAGIDADRHRRLAERGSLATGLPDDLVTLYERLRESSGGVGAAMLRARRCEGCRLELSGSDLSRVRSAAPDEVLRCEECRRILVRTAESGL